MVVPIAAPRHAAATVVCPNVFPADGLALCSGALPSRPKGSGAHGS